MANTRGLHLARQKKEGVKEGGKMKSAGVLREVLQTGDPELWYSRVLPQNRSPSGYGWGGWWILFLHGDSCEIPKLFHVTVLCLLQQRLGT